MRAKSSFSNYHLEAIPNKKGVQNFTPKTLFNGFIIHRNSG
jgi:hypothetical protein